MSTPDQFLPTLFTVVKKSYIVGAMSNSGNQKDTWGPPTEHAVYGWGPPESKAQITEAKAVYVDGTRFMVELALMVPPGFVSNNRDHFILNVTLEDYEAADPDSFEVYRQIGPLESYEFNPFGWNPGGVVNLLSAGGAP
jgi:hypothetical protein